MSSVSVREIVEAIKRLSSLELVKLNEELEGLLRPVSRPPKALDLDALSPERTSFSVIMRDCGPNKIQVIKVARSFDPPTPGFKDVVDRFLNRGALIIDGVDRETAMRLKEEMKYAGATVEIV